MSFKQYILWKIFDISLLGVSFDNYNWLEIFIFVLHFFNAMILHFDKVFEFETFPLLLRKHDIPWSQPFQSKRRFILSITALKSFHYLRFFLHHFKVVSHAFFKLLDSFVSFVRIYHFNVFHVLFRLNPDWLSYLALRGYCWLHDLRCVNCLKWLLLRFSNKNFFGKIKPDYTIVILKEINVHCKNFFV